MQIVSTSSSPPTHGYYTVKVRSRAEMTVSAALRDKGFDVLLPTFCSVRKYSDRIRKVDCALFPGYVFVAMDLAELYRVSVTPGVDYIVKVCNSLHPMPAVEVDLLKALSGMQSGYEPCVPYALGERVRIESGPLRGQTGVLVRNMRQDRVVLSLNSIFSSVSIDLRDTIVRPYPSTSQLPVPAYRELSSGWVSMPSEAA